MIESSPVALRQLSIDRRRCGPRRKPGDLLAFDKEAERVAGRVEHYAEPTVVTIRMAGAGRLWRQRRPHVRQQLPCRRRGSRSAASSSVPLASLATWAAGTSLLTGSSTRPRQPDRQLAPNHGHHVPQPATQAGDSRNPPVARRRRSRCTPSSIAHRGCPCPSLWFEFTRTAINAGVVAHIDAVLQRPGGDRWRRSGHVRCVSGGPSMRPLSRAPPRIPRSVVRD